MKTGWVKKKLEQAENELRKGKVYKYVTEWFVGDKKYYSLNKYWDKPDRKGKGNKLNLTSAEQSTLQYIGGKGKKQFLRKIHNEINNGLRA